MIGSEHTVRAYDKELDELGRRIAEMGGIAEKMLIDAMDALAAAMSLLRQQVVGRDPRLDALAARDRGAGDPDDRAAPADGGRPARDHRARSASRAISNASAISPRTSPSGRSRSAPKRACRARSSASST